MAEKKKNLGGRPTDYCEDLLKQCHDYLENYNTKYNDMIPSVEGLASHIGRARSTMYLWAKDENKAAFIDILAQINETQKKVLINKGLSGEFNSNITKLVLGVHGVSERLHQEHSGPDGKPIEITGIDVVFKK